MRLIRNVLCTIGIVAVLMTVVSPSGLVCAVNEGSFLFDNWQQLQEPDRYKAGYEHALGKIEVKAFPNTVYCSWHGFEIPTPGSLLFWRVRVKK